MPSCCCCPHICRSHRPFAQAVLLLLFSHVQIVAPLKLTLEELAQYGGSDPAKSLLLAVCGTVLDVSAGKSTGIVQPLARGPLVSVHASSLDSPTPEAPFDVLLCRRGLLRPRGRLPVCRQGVRPRLGQIFDRGCR